MRRVLGFILLLTAPGLACAEEKFFLKAGDRVVFYGDSITDQRLYTSFAESFVLTRFPNMPVTFVHSGWGGDTVRGGGGGPIDLRLKRDVLAYQPTVMTIMLGMNDASYRPFDQKIFDTYAKGYEHILETVKSQAPGIRFTLVVPSPFDDVTRAPTFEGGYNAVLLRYGEFVKELAKRQGATVADLNTSVVEATKKAKEIDAKSAEKLNPDRVHPGPGGQFLMAAALLKAWNAPAVVSDVRIDTAGDQPNGKAENAEINDLKREEGGISWVERDNALPFPLDLNDPIIALAAKASDFVEALDRQMLRVEGLKEGTYAIRIDGKDVASVTAKELSEGVNLATLDTPMRKQASHVHDLTRAHNDLHFLRWRQVQIPFEISGSPDAARAVDVLDRTENELVSAQRARAQPALHRFEVRPK